MLGYPNYKQNINIQENVPPHSNKEMEIEVTPRYHLVPLKITLRKSCGGWNETDRFSISLVALKIKYSPLGEQYGNTYKDMPHP